MSILRFTLVACALACCLALSGGCMKSKAITGRPIPDDKVAMIKDGETTSEQILVWFGAPDQQNTLGDLILYVYKYTEVEGSGWYAPYYGRHDTKQNCDELTITFDKTTGKVKAHSINRGINKEAPPAK